MSIRSRVGRLVRAVGAAAGDNLSTVQLLPVPAGEPVGPPHREGSRLTLPFPEAGPFPPLPRPVTYKLVVGVDPVDLV